MLDKEIRSGCITLETRNAQVIKMKTYLQWYSNFCQKAAQNEE